MSQNFGCVTLPDRFCTGLSTMPQKKNPDVPELAHGKTGRVVGHLMRLITLLKGQRWPTTRTTEAKEPLFDTVDTLPIFTELVAGIGVNAEAMEHAALRGHATPTDPARLFHQKGLGVSRCARDRRTRG